MKRRSVVALTALVGIALQPFDSNCVKVRHSRSQREEVKHRSDILRGKLYQLSTSRHQRLETLCSPSAIQLPHRQRFGQKGKQQKKPVKTLIIQASNPSEENKENIEITVATILANLSKKPVPQSPTKNHKVIRGFWFSNFGNRPPNIPNT